MYNKYTHKKFYHRNQIDEAEYSEKSYQRISILEKYEKLISESCSEKAALEVLEISRATLFRWKRKYKLLGLSGLEDESKIPITKRKSTWTSELENRIYHLRIKYPLWGKAKISIAYQREYKEKLSISMIGRIIKKLIETNKIYPVQFLLYKKIKKNREFNGHSQRLPLGMKAMKVGELIQIDHMEINVPMHGRLKQFSAICPITKIAVEQIYKEANSRNATDFLKKVITDLPFKVLSIQVDGGAEFMKHFENLCEKLKIPLYVLPPKRPEYNCNVERGNGTFKYEFHAQTTATNIHLLKKKLQKFVDFYNRERPHHGINLLTPYQFYESINLEVKKSHM